MKSYVRITSIEIKEDNRLNYTHAESINKIKRFIVSRMTNAR